MTAGYAFTATCPPCGGPLSIVAQGEYGTTETRATTRCDTCQRGWLIQVRLVARRGHNVRQVAQVEAARPQQGPIIPA